MSFKAPLFFLFGGVEGRGLFLVVDGRWGGVFLCFCFYKKLKTGGKGEKRAARWECAARGVDCRGVRACVCGRGPNKNEISEVWRGKMKADVSVGIRVCVFHRQ